MHKSVSSSAVSLSSSKIGHLEREYQSLEKYKKFHKTFSKFIVGNIADAEIQFTLLTAWDGILFPLYYEKKEQILTQGNQYSQLSPLQRLKEYLFDLRRVTKYFKKVKDQSVLPATDVLAIEYFPNSVQINLPLIKRLSKHTSVSFIASRHKVIEAVGQPDQVRIIDLEPYLSCGIIEFLWISRKIKTLFRQFSSQYSEFQSLMTVLQQGGTSQFFHAYVYVKSIWSILEQLKPRIILSSGFHSVDTRTCLTYGKRFSTATFLFQHGIMERTPLSYYIAPDYVGVWGTYFAKTLPYPPDTHKIVIGSAKHAKLKVKYQSFATKKGNVLIVSSPPSGKFVTKTRYRELAKFYVAVAQQNPSKHFIYKIHPSESLQEAQKIFEKNHSPSNLEVTNSNLYEALAQAEFVICVTSTVAYEAILFQKKLILIDIGYNHLFNFGDRVPRVLPEEPITLTNVFKQFRFVIDAQYAEQFFAIQKDALQNSVNLILSPDKP